MRFPGQYHDDETGLHYNWHRYYNPTTGRYISSDPIGLAGGLNTFGYAYQNPTGHVDPDGKLAFVPAILWGVGAYIATSFIEAALLETQQSEMPNGSLQPVGGIPLASGFGAAATAGKLCGTTSVTSSGYSSLADVDFLTEVARRAEGKIGGTGAVAGSRKHSYAEKLTNRYQQLTGQRQNLTTEQSYLGGTQVPRGTAGSARPDVYDPASGAIYDFKFTTRPGRGIPTRQQNHNLQNVPHVTSQTEINP